MTGWPEALGGAADDRAAESPRAAAPTASRRRFLGMAALAAGSLGLLSACGGRSASTAPPTQAVVAAMASTSTASAASAEKRPPNVLLITVDTLRADQLGAYGQKVTQTPALDTFAAQGARFAWHVVQQPQTVPSHGSILTGMYPSSNGLRVQLVDKLADTYQTPATVFKAQGYRTAALFSYNIFAPQNCNFQRGFDVYTDLTAGIPARVPGDIVKSPAGRTTDAAIDQIMAFGDSPFFMWLHYFDPHCPYEPPGDYATRYDPTYTGSLDGGIDTVYGILGGKLHPKGADLHHLLTLYQGEVSYFDSEIARLFAALDQAQLADRTIVALTGDHGESFAEHKDFVTDGDIFHPRSLYNTELHVPLLLRYPPAIRPGAVVEAPSRAIDIFPTLLDLASQPALPQFQGKSLRRSIDASGQGTARMAFSAMPDYVFSSVTTRGWKLIQNNATGQQHLFNLTKDPNELTDVQRGYADMASQLSAELRAWMVAEKISRK